MSHDNPSSQRSARPSGSEELLGVASAHDAGDIPSPDGRVPLPPGPSAGRDSGPDRADSSAVGHPQLDRHRSGIPREDLADAALAAFGSGDPATVFEAVSKLVEAYRELHGEAAKLRFQLNFGSPICASCDGLKAGPGVIATCFQVRRCNYENVREGGASERHLRIIQSLGMASG